MVFYTQRVQELEEIIRRMQANGQGTAAPPIRPVRAILEPPTDTAPPSPASSPVVQDMEQPPANSAGTQPPGALPGLVRAAGIGRGVLTVHSATARAVRRCATAIRMPSTPTAGPATDGQCSSSQWWIRATGIT